MCRHFISLLCLFAIIAGCSEPAVMLGEKTTETAKELPALLVMNQEQKLVGKQVIPNTLEHISSTAALEFGHHYSYTLSPNGKQIAAIIWPSGEDNHNGTLHLINTGTWKDTLIPAVSLDGDVSHLTFSSNGKQLYWTEPTDLSISPSFRLTRYDIAEKQLSTVVEFPSATVPIEVKLLPEENLMVVYGVPAVNSRTPGHPSLYFINLKEDCPATSLPLEGITVGNTGAGTEQQNEPSFYYLRPGLAWDLGRKQLYIASADEEKITLVDLAAKKVKKQESINPLRSFGERLNQLLLPSAQAKMATGAQRQAIASADGQYLFVTGKNQDLKKDADGRQLYSEIPIGLRIIATADFREVDRLTLPVSQIALTPDGGQLLMAGSTLETEVEGMWEDARKGSGLYLYDTVKRTQTAHIQPGKSFYLRGFTFDGNYACLSSFVGRPGKEVLTVIHPTSGQVLAERQADQWFIDLLPLKGREEE